MNILITTAGRRTYIIDYFKQALDGDGKIIATNSVYTHTLSQADEFVITPSFYSHQYITVVLDICKEKDIDAVISLLDADAKVLSMHRPEFEKIGTRLIVSSTEVMDTCNDKFLSYQFLRSINLLQPKSYIHETDVKLAVQSQEITYPIIIKPRWGIGSFGVYFVDNEEELDVFSMKLRKDILKTYMGYESAKDIEGCILYQEVIPGQEYGVQILNDFSGQYVATFALKKLAMRSGETDIAETVDADFFLSDSIKISSNLRHIGLLDMDCMVTQDGKIYVIEMNCRFGGQYPFTHLANVDVPRQIVYWLRGGGKHFEFLTQSNGIKACKELRPVLI